jgi:ATP-dependent DNA helicase RecG
MPVLTEKPLKELKGIGEARSRVYSKLKINTIGDLLYHFPRQYEDRRKLKRISELTDGESCAFLGMAASRVVETRPRRNLTIQKLRIKDGTGEVIAVWFNRTYLKRTLQPGRQYMFYGKISKRFGMAEVQNPEYEPVEKAEDSSSLCRIVPIYPSTSNLTQNMIRKDIRNALELTDCSLEEMLPDWVRQEYRLCEINYSIRNIHFPKDENALENARYRLVFQELLIFQLGLYAIKQRMSNTTGGIRFSPVPGIDDFISRLPFKLTGAQQRALDEISRDMESEKVMNRLLVGDVGSGKTIVALITMLKAIYNGYQAALMAPTEILAEQHYATVNRYLRGMGINVELLTGSVTKKEKARIQESIREGNASLIIGTHALIQEDLAFNRLGLVVTDEQHRFGVRQRAVFSAKGENPDVLVMTATPIPRTLALILYGDLDISVIDEMPPGRKPVKTYAVDESMRERINNFIRKKVQEGRQVYIVCPLVDESEMIDASSAVETAERIAKEDFPDLRVKLIHGKMKANEKDGAMKDFADGKFDILVSTTVIEVGVDVPNATVMVVENAERFGLAQLHQLRGRVGRGEHQSYCILYNKGDSEVASERMKIMTKTNNGFEIAEKDLEIRGPGDFFGTRQHGLPELNIANLYRDMNILKTAQEAADRIMKEDGGLEDRKNIKLRKVINEKFHEKLKELSMN